MTLFGFLSARLDEDEAQAEWHHRLLCLRIACRTCEFNDDEAEIAADRVCTCDYPLRVLADVAAKRQIVGRCSTEEGLIVLRHLAQPYADHPDFREEWRA